VHSNHIGKAFEILFENKAHGVSVLAADVDLWSLVPLCSDFVNEPGILLRVTVRRDQTGSTIFSGKAKRGQEKKMIKGLHGGEAKIRHKDEISLDKFNAFHRSRRMEIK
jgi:hypothetical protein